MYRNRIPGVFLLVGLLGSLRGAVGGLTWTLQTVDSGGYVGHLTSLALDSSGNPHISYHDSTNRDLKYAAWNGSAWDLQTVDSGGDVGMYTSLALDSNGNPHISYYDSTNGDLKYAYASKAQAPIPEASTLALFGLGSLGLLFWRRRKGR